MSKQYINTSKPGAEQQARRLAKRGYVAVEIVGVTLVMARKLYKDLQEDYFYLTSDDAIAETLAINDYFFTDGGHNATVYS